MPITVSLSCNAGLRTLEVTHNQIHTLPGDIGDLRHLECLYMRHNKIANLPSLDNCTSLKVRMYGHLIIISFGKLARLILYQIIFLFGIT